jgi:type IV pilus assembly protein PilN
MNGLSPRTINLASHPFRRERAQNAAYAMIAAVLACTLAALLILILHERARAGDLRRVIEAQSRALQKYQREQTQFSTVLAKPENADVFSTSVFLNELIARRAVSWTRVFKDLATVMPSNMRLMGIRLPQIPTEDASGTNHVQLDMVVGTDRPDAVIDLLKRLEQSSLFGAASVVTQQPPTQNDPLYKFRVTVGYAQKL